MNKQMIKLGDNQIAFFESEGKGRDIILIHGNSLSSKSYSKQIESSIGKKFHIVAPDLPGHGDSISAKDPRNTYSLPGYAEIILDLIKQLKLSNIIIVGHSLGGHIALEVSDISNEIRGIIIFGTPPLGIPPKVNDAFLDQRFFPSLLMKEETEVPQLFINDFNNTDPKARTFLMRNTAKNIFKDEIQLVENLKIPLGVLYGAYDKVINLNYIKNIKMPTLWRNKIQIIEDSGHSPQWEKPEVFNGILEEFLREVN